MLGIVVNNKLDVKINFSFDNWDHSEPKFDNQPYTIQNRRVSFLIKD